MQGQSADIVLRAAAGIHEMKRMSPAERKASANRSAACKCCE